MRSFKKILIVDSSDDFRYQLGITLKNSNYDVVGVAGELGLYNKIEEYGMLVDMIIMDINLKNEDGLNLLNRVKQHDKYSKIPVIVFTEKTELDVIKKVKELGINSFLKKPSSNDEIIKRIKFVFAE